MGQKYVYLNYSKASRYTTTSCMDLAGARFWIGSKKFLSWANLWNENLEQHHLAFILLSNKSCTNFELQEFFLSQRNVHLNSQGLSVVHKLWQKWKNMSNLKKSKITKKIAHFFSESHKNKNLNNCKIVIFFFLFRLNFLMRVLFSVLFWIWWDIN